MNRNTARQLLGILVVLLIGMVVLIAMMTSCTLVVIRGNGNTTSDTGGHDGGLRLERAQQSTLKQRLDQQGESR